MQTVKPAVKDTPVSTAAAQDAQQPNVTAGSVEGGVSVVYLSAKGGQDRLVRSSRRRPPASWSLQAH
ncbi:hypothetical protein WJX75_002543 [Coccomyxa subellipsoidea]|uniref:Uncharacterized protein n=1 Tax=Coccomyxa subellipsoidea TaxID=248742 RepID=A0ABR2YM23_9CHLO